MSDAIQKEELVSRIGETDRIVNERAIEKLRKARIQLLLKNSFFGNMAVRLKLTNADSWCETAATDGINFYYNSKFIDALTPGELVFLCGHEILHVVYDHMDRRGDRDPQLWNIADDYAVNADLVRHNVGEFITTVPCLFDKKYDKLSADAIYDDLFKKAKKIDIDDLLSKVLDQHLTEKDSKKTSAEKDEIKREIRQAILNAAQLSKPGDMPAGVVRFIKDITEPTMNWRDLLNTNIVSTFRNDYSWMRVSRRGWHTDAIMPGMIPGEMIKIAVAIDMSGSISKDQAALFLGEIQGIMESFQNYQIHVISFDTKVYNPRTFDSENLENISEYSPKGGGGTDFSCIFKYLVDESIVPDCLVVFTDGYTCNWGDENYCDTTWIIYGNPGDVTPPWGTWAYLSNKKMTS